MTENQQTTKPETPEEFWVLYLQEHRHLTTRWMHTLGTLASWSVFGVALWLQIWWLILLAPVVGYGLAWCSHAFFEKNRPLSMRYPVRSFLADYKLTCLMLLGRNPSLPNPKNKTEGAV